MATKNYMINDKWLDLDKQNIVELQSVDGELDSLKVNGSEIVTPSGKITITENGTDIDIAQYATADVSVEGGSSDFSTAEVTLSATGDFSLRIASIVDNEIHTTVPSFIESFEAILYKGSQVCDTSEIMGTITVSGDAVYDSDEQTITITGDCTITITIS